MSDSPPRRSSRGRPHVESFERSDAEPLKRPCLERLHRIVPTKSYSKDILAALFSVMTDHVWYTITQNSDENTLDIGYAMGQRYQQILSIFIDLGYIIKEGDNTVLQGGKVG